MNTKIILSRFALAVAAGMAAGSLQAQGTLTATATITETGMVGSEYEYSLALDNTGNTPINAFWYGWIQGSFDLPSTPTSITAPSGWSSSTSFPDSVQFANNTGSAIAPGGFVTFTFESTSSPTAMTTGTTDGAPTGDSIAYATLAAMASFDQSDPGVASGPFVPTLVTVPEPSTLALLTAGLTGLCIWQARRRSRA
jgi:hypothetical protein